MDVEDNEANTSLFKYIETKKPSFKKEGFGWLMGLEPTTHGTTIRYSNQLSYSHRWGRKNNQAAQKRKSFFEWLSFQCAGSFCSVKWRFYRVTFLVQQLQFYFHLS